MSQINTDYDNIITSNPEEMARAIRFLEEEMDKREVRFGENRLHAFLKPVFISHNDDERFFNIIKHIMEILEKVSRLYFTHSDLREYFYIDDDAAELVEVDPGFSKTIVISRPDSFLVHEDDLKFVEFNCDSPAGAGLCDLEEEIFKETFPLQKIKESYLLEEKIRRQFLLDALLEAYHEFAGSTKKPNIAIVDWKEVKTQGEFKILKNYFMDKGYETVIADPCNLKLKKGKLYYKRFPIDLVYRRAIFRELIERKKDVQDFLTAYKNNQVCVVNPLRSRLASNKATLAIITDLKNHGKFFSEEEKNIIKHHIPWTRRVIDMQTHYEDNLVFLLKHIVNHKDTLVLKPSDSYGGKDVAIGCETKQEEWTNLVNRILYNKEDWVVQKYVDITKMDVPEITNGEVCMVTKKFNLNPFVFGHRYAGSMARLSDESVINVSAGGGLIPAIKYSKN